MSHCLVQTGRRLFFLPTPHLRSNTRNALLLVKQEAGLSRDFSFLRPFPPAARSRPRFLCLFPSCSVFASASCF